MSYLNDFKYWDVTPDTAKKKTTVNTLREKYLDLMEVWETLESVLTSQT